MKKSIFLFILLTIISFCSLKINYASATAYLEYEKSCDFLGVTPKEELPLELINNEITFDTLSSKSSITSEYTILNNSQNDITTDLVFPYLPEKTLKTDSEGKNYYVSLDDEFKVYVNDELVTKNYFYTYGDIDNFDIDKDLKKIRTDYYKDGQIKDDTKVFKHTFANKTDEDYYVTLTVSEEENKTFFGDFNTYSYNAVTKEITYTTYCRPDYTFKVYFLGNDRPNFLSECKIFKDNNFNTLVSEHGIYDIEQEELTFLDLIFNYYNNLSDVSKVDYYNAIQDKLIDYEYKIDSIYFFNIDNSLTKWGSYNINIKANETISTKVIAPANCYIDNYYNYPKTCFNYSFSTLKGWQKVNSIDIKVYTNVYLLDSTLGEFEKTNDYYSLHLDTIPERINLSFSICESETPTPDYDYPFTSVLIVLIAIFSIIIIIVSIGLFIFFIIALIKLIRNKTISIGEKFVIVIQSILSFISISLINSLEYNDIQNLNGIFISIIVINVIILLTALIEQFKVQYHSINKIIILSIAFIISIIAILLEDNLLSITILLYYIIIIINIVRSFKNNEKVNNKYYPIGHFSYKQPILVSIEITLIILSTILGAYFNLSSVILILLEIALIASIILTIYLINYQNVKPFKEFDKDLDYQKLETTINEKLSNPKINPETVNYFKILLSSRTIAFSIDKYNEINKEIFIPSNKTMLLNYDLSKLTFLLNKAELENKYLELKNKYRKNKTAFVQVDQFMKHWRIYWGEDFSGPIDKILPYNTKNDFENAFNLFIQINYYQRKNNLTKANELKSLFMSKYSFLTTLSDALNGKEIHIQQETFFCMYCGNRINKDDIFCTRCGKKIEN